MASLTTPSASEPAAAIPQPRIGNFACLDYLPVWQAMQAYTDQRDGDAPDQFWLLEHPPVFTQGQAGQPEHLLAPGDIPVIQVDRGGQVTYHGPGQLVVYPLLDIERLGLAVRDLVTRLEQALIDLMADYGLDTARRQNAPGVYLGEAKIASLGLRVRHGRCFHGLALNADMDLEPFSRINPCGMAGMAVTSMAEHVPLDTSDYLAGLKTALLGHLWRQLCYNGQPPALPEASEQLPG